MTDTGLLLHDTRLCNANCVLCVPPLYLFLISISFVTSNQITGEFIAHPWSTFCVSHTALLHYGTFCTKAFYNHWHGTNKLLSLDGSHIFFEVIHGTFMRRGLCYFGCFFRQKLGHFFPFFPVCSGYVCLYWGEMSPSLCCCNIHALRELYDGVSDSVGRFTALAWVPFLPFSVLIKAPPSHLCARQMPIMLLWLGCLKAAAFWPRFQCFNDVISLRFGDSVTTFPSKFPELSDTDVESLQSPELLLWQHKVEEALIIPFTKCFTQI